MSEDWKKDIPLISKDEFESDLKVLEVVGGPEMSGHDLAYTVYKIARYVLTYGTQAARIAALEAKVQELESILATQNIVLEQYRHQLVVVGFSGGDEPPPAPERSERVKRNRSGAINALEEIGIKEKLSLSAPEASKEPVKTKECNLCGGKGKIKRRELGLHAVGYNQLSDELIKCRHCNGTGKVPADAQGESQEKEVKKQGGKDA